MKERRADRTVPSRPASLLAALVGCATVAACAGAFESPGVRIAGVRVASLGLVEGTAAVELEVTNPNRRALELRGVSYRLRIEDTRRESGWIILGEGFHSEGVTIPPEDTTRVAVTVPFGYEAVEVAVRSLLREGNLNYRLDGEVRIRGPVGDLRMPLDHRGSFVPPGGASGEDAATRNTGARARTSRVRSGAAGIRCGAHALKSNSTTDESFPHS